MGKEYDGIHRTTFVIDEEGNIEDVITKVKTKEHSAQIYRIINKKGRLITVPFFILLFFRFVFSAAITK